MNKLLWFTVLVLLLSWADSRSCECVIPPFKTAEEMSDEIFIGKVLKIQREERGGVVYWKTTLEKLTNWKGNNKKYIEITGFNSCDFNFGIHHLNYLVYARRNEENAYETSYCMRTGVLNGISQQDEDLVLLKSNFSEIKTESGLGIWSFIKHVIQKLISFIDLIIG